MSPRQQRVELGAPLRRGCRARLARRLARPRRPPTAPARGPGGARAPCVRGHHLRERPRHLQRLQRLRRRRIARRAMSASQQPPSRRRRSAAAGAGHRGTAWRAARAEAGFSRRGAAGGVRGRRRLLLRRVRGTGSRTSCKASSTTAADVPPSAAPAPVRALGRRRGDAAPVALPLLAGGARSAAGDAALERRRRRDELPDNLQRIHRDLGVLRARRARGDLQQRRRGAAAGAPTQAATVASLARVQRRRSSAPRVRPGRTRRRSAASPAARRARAPPTASRPPCATKASTGSHDVVLEDAASPSCVAARTAVRRGRREATAKERARRRCSARESARRCRCARARREGGGGDDLFAARRRRRRELRGGGLGRPSSGDPPAASKASTTAGNGKARRQEQRGVSPGGSGRPRLERDVRAASRAAPADAAASRFGASSRGHRRRRLRHLEQTPVASQWLRDAQRRRRRRHRGPRTSPRTFCARAASTPRRATRGAAARTTRRAAPRRAFV